MKIKVQTGEQKTAVLTRLEDREFEIAANARLTLVLAFTAADPELHHLNIDLTGKNAELNLIGFFIGHEKDFFRLHAHIRHLAPETKSNTLVRGLLCDQSKVDFHGNIWIEKKAHQSDAYLKHDTLLLSDKAKSTSTPALEILAEDVKAGHAATTGKPEEESLFYLMSRGLERNEAQDLLIDGFVEEGLRRIANARAREATEVLVRRAIRQEQDPTGCCGGTGCGCNCG